MSNKKLISYLLVLIIVGFLFFNVSKDWQVVTKFNWNFSIENILFIILFSVPLYLISATSWHLLTKSLGFNLTYSQNLKIWLYSNIGRFIPGVVWQYVGRVYLANEEGISKDKVLSALGLEAVFNLTAGFLVVLITVCFWGLPLGMNILSIIVFLIIILVTVVVTLNNVKVINYFVELISKLTKKEQKIARISLPLKWIPILLASYILQFIFDGSILFFLTRTAIDLSWNLYPLFIGIFAASWLLGYITIFSPSGLGVQELSIAGLLSVYIPFTIAGIIAILFRLLILSSELCTISSFYFFQKIIEQRQGNNY